MMYCEVCKKPLMRSGNHTLYYCPAEIRFVSKMNKNISYHHIFVGTSKEGRILRKIITLPPYIFDLDFEENITSVKKIISFRGKSLKNDPVTLDEDHDEADVFTINIMLDLPWDDENSLEEKIKIYNLFS